VNHLVVAPILVPLLTGALLVLLRRAGGGTQAAVSAAGLAALGASIVSLALAIEPVGTLAYLVGDWRAPFGIALAADRLAVTMLVLAFIVAVACWIAAFDAVAVRGPHWHALVHFQLMGLAGAFLTADLFNLFVFFEVLLIASYGLLLHGGGAERLRASLHYVVVNLFGSALFLVAAALLYGAVGTLNLADLAQRVAQAPEADRALVAAGGLLLLVVFAVKGALVPLQFWLPGTYTAAHPPVGALFAIMTKVGVYAVVRVHGTVFGPSAGALADLAAPWIIGAGLLTIVVGSLGVVAASTVRAAAAYLVVVSAGILFAVVGGTPRAGLGGALYYLVHSTLAAAALFLLASMLARQRGEAGDAILAGPRVPRAAAVGGCFLVAAIAVAGLPPLSGFTGKALMLSSLAAPGSSGALWFAILASGLLTVVALARAGSRIFWKSSTADVDAGANPPGNATVLASAWLMAAIVALSAAATPAMRYAAGAAAQLAASHDYTDAVLGASPVSSEAPR
jgi:multicomponent K+:H+ antiporter subunit D